MRIARVIGDGIDLKVFLELAAKRGFVLSACAPVSEREHDLTGTSG
jgi:hypothetical protein